MPYGKKAKGKSGMRKPYKPTNQLGSKALQVSKDRVFKQIQPNNVKPEPFPRVMLTRCKFGELNSITTTSPGNIASVKTYRLNSIWDPNYTDAGQTVVGHSVLASMYDQYWVMGAKVKLTFNDVPSDGWLVGYRLRINGNNTVSSEDVGTIVGQPNTYTSRLNNTGNQTKTFNFYVKPWSLVGVSKLEYLANSSTYSSAISASPAANQTCVFDVFAVSPSTYGTISYTIQIIYYVKLYSRKELYPTSF